MSKFDAFREDRQLFGHDEPEENISDPWKKEATRLRMVLIRIANDCPCDNDGQGCSCAPLALSTISTNDWFNAIDSKSDIEDQVEESNDRTELAREGIEIHRLEIERLRELCTERSVGAEAIANTAAPTSDPDGAATLGYHLISDAEFAAHGFGAKAATPSPTLEKLAQEIDDLYEAPSRIRLLRRILEREFGSSRSVAEVAKEIVEGSFGETHPYMETRRVESILSRFREHELRELREECGRLRKDKERLDWFEDVLKSKTCDPLHQFIQVKEGPLYGEVTLVTYDGTTSHNHQAPTLRAAIDAAMQPSEETKP